MGSFSESPKQHIWGAQVFFSFFAEVCLQAKPGHRWRAIEQLKRFSGPVWPFQTGTAQQIRPMGPGRFMWVWILTRGLIRRTDEPGSIRDHWNPWKKLPMVIFFWPERIWIISGSLPLAARFNELLPHSASNIGSPKMGCTGKWNKGRTPAVWWLNVDLRGNRGFLAFAPRKFESTFLAGSSWVDLFLIPLPLPGAKIDFDDARLGVHRLCQDISQGNALHYISKTFGYVEGQISLIAFRGKTTRRIQPQSWASLGRSVEASHHNPSRRLGSQKKAAFDWQLPFDHFSWLGLGNCVALLQSSTKVPLWLWAISGGFYASEPEMRGSFTRRSGPFLVEFGRTTSDLLSLSFCFWAARTKLAKRQKLSGKPSVLWSPAVWNLSPGSLKCSICFPFSGTRLNLSQIAGLD